MNADTTARRRTVLVVDDSALIRAVVRDLIGEIDGFEVIGTASDGPEGLAAVKALAPDIVTLDVEMPGMDGLAVLERIMRDAPRPVVMLSGAETAGGVDLTLRALDLGAVDFVRKQAAGGAAAAQSAMGERLAAALRAAASANIVAVSRRSSAVPPVIREGTTAGLQSARSVVAMAASTGGPRALAEVFAGIPSEIDAAVVVVQHMPKGFTAGLAKRLAQATRFDVREAKQGDRLVAGRAYIAPGGSHMRVAVGPEGNEGARIVLEDGKPMWGVKPAADPLFISVASAFGENAVGVVLTGMGRDGALGLSAIREAGGGAVVQDEESSAVYGMPREALTLAGADRVVPPSAVGQAIAELLTTRVLK